MAFRIKPNKDQKILYKPKIVGEIRRSQIMTTYGPGSLVDFPRMSAIIEGIDQWESELGQKDFNAMKIHERNLERILSKKYFIRPKTPENSNFVGGIPARRFPEYCYCPECGALGKYYQIEKKSSNNTLYNQESYCGMCYQSKNRNVRLIPSRFITACEAGHLDEFPYEWWVHRKQGRCATPKLSIVFSKNVSGTDAITIKCSCGAKENLKGIMDQGALRMQCFGSMPWLGKNEDMRGWYSEVPKGESCENEVRVLQRGASNVYFPDLITALTIPPYSSRIQKILEADYEVLESYSKMPESLRKQNLAYYYESHKDKLRCDSNQFYNEIRYALEDTDKRFSDIHDLKRGEYDALCDEDCSDPDFLTIESKVPSELKGLIEQIKIVGRLREVQVLDGFRRMKPDGSIARLSKKPLEWLPGNELYGEGIFIRFRNDKITRWEKNSSDRYAMLKNRVKENPIIKEKISGGLRYILLHTFAHLLIRELSVQCGYTIASLKEKIYASDDNAQMCGVLIYTASPDSDGSLGGLARQGVTEKIRDTIFSMLESASWCSNDPICIDSNSQGYASLNYAACHACTLLPETSCELYNSLLDRGSIIGLDNDRSLGYFAELLA